MERLGDYRKALSPAYPTVPDTELIRAVEVGGDRFATFVIDHGLGPIWHACTGRAEFLEGRMAAEALYAAQNSALREVDDLLNEAGIDYVVFKGGANRMLLYDNPATRACHDIDLLVRPDDRIRSATLLADAGFRASPDMASISRELALCRQVVQVDLHWGLLREGRLRNDDVAEMLARRRRVGDLWMLSSEDALFTLLVHPAFAKHLGGWEMGLHRVLDIVLWIQSQQFDWQTVYKRLGDNGVRTAAWATLRWVGLLTALSAPAGLDSMLSDLQPGRLRMAWIDSWLQGDLSARTSQMHWARLLGFSLFLHDTPHDVNRALIGRHRARRRRENDLAAFEGLIS